MKALITATAFLGLALGAMFFCNSAGIRSAFASGPTEVDSDLDASYTFNTLKHPTGVAYYCCSLKTNVVQPRLLISDTDNHMIRQFDITQGTLSTFAGTGRAGYANGNPQYAEFNQPAGIQIVRYYGNSFSDVYVNDSSNYVVRHVAGTFPFYVSTLAGNGTKGSANGNLAQAQFAHLGGIKYSVTDNVFYVADAENSQIRKLDAANGTVSTYTGYYGPGYVDDRLVLAKFNTPSQVTWDSLGNMYVADTGNHVIRKIDHYFATVSTFAGSGQPGYVDGPPATAQFYRPTSIAYTGENGGTLYVLDMQNNAIRRIDMSGNVSTYAGSTQAGLVDGPGPQARFWCPTELAVGPGTLYVADTGNNSIRRIDLSTGYVTTYIH